MDEAIEHGSIPSEEDILDFEEKAVLKAADEDRSVEDLEKELEKTVEGIMSTTVEKREDFEDILSSSDAADYEEIKAGVVGPLPDHSTIRGSAKPIKVGKPTDISSGVDVDQPIPVVEGTHNFLHLVPYKNHDGEKWWRYVISPFDVDETARWLKHRDVITKYGLDVAPCDYWDLKYLCSIYYDEAGEEIGVFQITNSSAMAELDLFQPLVEEELRDDEIAKLLDAETKAELIRVSSELKTAKEKIRWWEEYTKALIAAKDETGGKMFAHMADMASKLPETDRWEVPGQKKGIVDRITKWLEKHQTVKMILTLVVVFGSLFLLLLATGIIRIRG